MFQTNPFFRPDTQASDGPGRFLALALTDDTTRYLLALTLALAAILLIGTFRHSRPWRRSRWTPRRGRPSAARTFPDSTAPLRLVTPSPAPDSTGLRDPARQMEAISRVEFETVPLLNRSEARLLPALEAATRGFDSSYRLMAQTSLGEILAPKRGGESDQVRNDAFFSINAKRLDFAVFNRFGHLVVAVEYQGHGHYHTTSFMRDAVKREALRKAGVPFLELPAEISPDEAGKLLSAALGAQARRSA